MDQAVDTAAAEDIPVRILRIKDTFFIETLSELPGNNLLLLSSSRRWKLRRWADHHPEAHLRPRSTTRGWARATSTATVRRSHSPEALQDYLHQGSFSPILLSTTASSRTCPELWEDSHLRVGEETRRYPRLCCSRFSITNYTKQARGLLH